MDAKFEPPVTGAFPPGLVGEIAKEIYGHSFTKSAEIALTAGIGLMSGIVGRTYTINDLNLNLYLMIVAGPATGKGSINYIHHIMHSTADEAGNKELADFTSGTFGEWRAVKAVLDRKPNSFVSEFGYGSDCFIRERSSAGIRMGKFLDAYKEADGTFEPGKKSFTIIAQAYPEPYYSSLTESHVEFGLEPSFIVINHNRLTEYVENEYNSGGGEFPSRDLRIGLASVAERAFDLTKQEQSIEVLVSPNAEALLRDYDETCEYTEYENMVMESALDTAPLKAKRLAAVCACGLPFVDDNGVDKPLVTEEAASWAIRIVKLSVEERQNRFDRGDTGEDADVIRTALEFIYGGGHTKYGAKPAMVKDRVITHSALHKRLSGLSYFHKQKETPGEAFKRVLGMLVNRGAISPLSKAKMVDRYNFFGVGYEIEQPKDHKDMRTYLLYVDGYCVDAIEEAVDYEEAVDIARDHDCREFEVVDCWINRHRHN